MAMVLDDLKGMVAGTCVSGGLDSRTIAKVMMEAGVKVIGFTGGIGQPDEKDINDVAKRMAPTGIETVIVDLRDEMADACLEAVKCQAMYDGGYWNSTGIGRAVTIKGLIPEMKKRGVQVLVHGATGRGNDQMRIERYTNVFAPEMKVYSPRWSTTSPSSASSPSPAARRNTPPTPTWPASPTRPRTSRAWRPR